MRRVGLWNVALVVTVMALGGCGGKIVAERLFHPCQKGASCPQCRGAGSYRCTACGGRGNMQCDTCGGRGQSRCLNVSCQGGKSNCYSCGGTGQTWRFGTGAALGQQTLGPCSSCAGTGKRNCTSCNGTGQSNCVKCGGTGMMSCSTCRGQGMMKCGHTTTRYRCRGCGAVYDYRPTECPQCLAK